MHRAARRRPRRADARPRPARSAWSSPRRTTTSRRCSLERVPLHRHVRDRRRLPVDADGAADGRATRARPGSPRSSGGSSSPPARARSSRSSSRARPTARALLAAAVHRDVVRLGPRGVPASCSRRSTPGTGARCRRRRRAPDAQPARRCSSSRVLYFTLVYHLTNVYFAKQTRLRALHPRRRRRLSAALLVGLRRRRQPRAAGARSATRASTRSRVARRGLAARRRRRVRAALRVHHRRTGVAARHLPRLRGRAAASATAQIGRYAPSLPEILLGARRRRHRLPDHGRRRARAAVPARRTTPPRGRTADAPGGGAQPDGTAGRSPARRVLDLAPRTSRRARRRSPSACAPRSARARARGPAVQEGAGLHRPDVARAATRPALPQPRSVPLRRSRDPRRVPAPRRRRRRRARRGQQGALRRPRARRQQQQRGARARCSACRSCWSSTRAA